jgi:hypothetical protein
MNANLVRLRKSAAHGGDTGSPDERDRLISGFLEELQSVICAEVIDRSTDAQLRSWYVKWANALLAGATEDQRATWMSEGVIVFMTAYKPAEMEEAPSNVVRMARR